MASGERSLMRANELPTNITENEAKQRILGDIFSLLQAQGMNSSYASKLVGEYSFRSGRHDGNYLQDHLALAVYSQIKQMDWKEGMRSPQIEYGILKYFGYFLSQDVTNTVDPIPQNQINLDIPKEDVLRNFYTRTDKLEVELFQGEPDQTEKYLYIISATIKISGTYKKGILSSLLAYEQAHAAGNTELARQKLEEAEGRLEEYNKKDPGTRRGTGLD